MPGGVIGDPHLTRLDGRAISFPGRPGATYRLFEFGPLQIRCTLAAIPGMASDDAPRTIVSDLTVSSGPFAVAIPIDGQVRVWSPGVDLTLDTLRCNLPAHRPGLADHADAMKAREYINVHFDTIPDDLAGASGLMVDGDDSPECEARHRLHPAG
jgi:hypothetical protein